MEALDLEHYLIAAIVSLAGALVYLWQHHNKVQAKKDADLLQVTQDYARQCKEMAVESTKAYSGVQTSIENNTKVIERLLDRDENSTRRR